MSNEVTKANIASLMRHLALGLLLVGAVAVLPKTALAQRNGDLHIVKECHLYTGLAGDYCTIISSNLAAIPPGARVYYDQAAGIPTTQTTVMLDSNVLVNVSSGDWATGRCTLDLTTNLGLCQFTDGTGPLTGFQARVDVSYAPGGNGFDFRWDGTYGFTPPGGLK
jgi:hypothetical protein